MNYEEYLAWCKQRAIEYVDEGDLTNAMASMVSDLNKHEELRDHPAIQLGMMLTTCGNLSTTEEMRKFILGFN